jgi:adenylate cyclase
MGVSICIVDDSATQRILLTSILTAAGYTKLLAADSARTAFRHLGMDSPERPAPAVDLILMDISMPEMDGIEATRAIKAVPALQDIPIIMVTGSTEADSLQQAFAAGAIDYITKPVNQIELLARVRSALRLKYEMDRRKAREQELLDVTHQLREAMSILDEKHRLLQDEQERSERLLLNILPQPIAERLKREPGVLIADSFSEATVLFADIADFTRLSARIAPKQLIELLNQVFSGFDRLAEKHGLEKIKTIGDSYMVVGGLPTPRHDHAEAVAEMALDIKTALAGQTLAGEPLEVRIGIHTGPVVAGVIGTKKFIYDLWGDTVNIASRMETHGVHGQIQVTADLHERLRDRYSFEPRGSLQVKGKGEMLTYLLTGRRSGAG